MSPSRPDDDLGALIGDIRLEAARRRSDPAYPLADETAIDEEMRQWSPQPPIDPLERLAGRAEAAATASPGAAPSGPRRSGPPRSGQPAGPSPDLAGVVADALRTLSARLADLERRLRRVERGLAGGVAGPTALPFPAGAGAAPAPEALRPEALRPEALRPEALRPESLLPDSLLTPGPGRVLCFADDPAPTVAALRARGVDAYGLTPNAGEYAGGPDVRSGQLLDHLASVGDSALAAVVAVGLAVAAAGPGPGEVAGEMGRTAPLAIVLAEAPWWWRTQQGAGAELASVRPLSPELWLEAFSSTGMEVRAEYEDGGRAYRIVARR